MEEINYYKKIEHSDYDPGDFSKFNLTFFKFNLNFFKFNLNFSKYTF